MIDLRAELERAARIETCATPDCDFCLIRKQAAFEGAEIALREAERLSEGYCWYVDINGETLTMQQAIAELRRSIKESLT